MMLLMPIWEAPRPEFGLTQRLPPVPLPPCWGWPVAGLFHMMPLAPGRPEPPVVPQAGMTTAAIRATTRPAHTQALLLDIVLTPLVEFRDSNILRTYAPNFSMRPPIFIVPPRLGRSWWSERRPRRRTALPLPGPAPSWRWFPARGRRP